jgi:hypothetical protein
MNNLSRTLKFIAACIVIGSCAKFPEESAQITPTDTVLEPTLTAGFQRLTATAPPVVATPTPIPGQGLPEADEVLFTIPNPEPWYGKEGDPRPDWLGWGGETFTIAPDGSFWIADSAVDSVRLLHFKPMGELIGQISLEDLVVFPYDMVASGNSLWVLDIAADPAKVVQLSYDGKLLGEQEIPREIMEREGEYVANGVFNLWTGEDGALIVSGINGLYELVDASGGLSGRPMEAFSYAGHTYWEGIYDGATGQMPLYVDGELFETDPQFFVEGEPFLGFNPDGSFAITGYVQEEEFQLDFQVKYFTPAGVSMGTARQHPQTFYKDYNHHLAFGPDGSIYQLLSNPDHSVQVMKLGFPVELPPRGDLTRATPTPLVPLQPSVAAATDEEQARNALVAFFYNLGEGNYSEAAASFGGEINEYARDPLPGETIEAYWDYLCGYLWCLPVAEITDVAQVSEDEYTFYVVFVAPEGRRFEIGACCGGDPAAIPPVWQFAYPVKKIEGEFKVMRGPLFTP